MDERRILTKAELKRNTLGLRAFEEDRMEYLVREAKIDVLYQMIEADLEATGNKGTLSELANAVIRTLGYEAVISTADPNESLFFSPYLLKDQKTGEVCERKTDFTKFPAYQARMRDGDSEASGKMAGSGSPKSKGSNEAQKETGGAKKEERIYLTIPPASENVSIRAVELFRKNGAKFDPEKRRWYINSDADRSKFTDFLCPEEEPRKKTRKER